ncbi:MAG TPA: YbhB/YbcL family Raf kinase inhibitor-like protein [Candidatus Obscuribacterales bacterium]
MASRKASYALVTGLFVLMTSNLPAAAEAEKATITLKSSAFSEGANIPKAYTADGSDSSPPLKWSGAPSGTKSFALSLKDPDAPKGAFVHWTIINIPPNATELKEGLAKTPSLPDGALQGTNDFNKAGYNGPSPPKGSSHKYEFKVVALDTKLNLKPGFSRSDYSKAIKGHVIGAGKLVGVYSR